jgi:hypothetical protein
MEQSNVFTIYDPQSFLRLIFMILLFSIFIGALFVTLLAFLGVFVIYWSWQLIEKIWDIYNFSGIQRYAKTEISIP